MELADNASFEAAPISDAAGAAPVIGAAEASSDAVDVDSAWMYDALSTLSAARSVLAAIFARSAHHLGLVSIAVEVTTAQTAPLLRIRARTKFPRLADGVS
jgi:hypothetical protein